MTTDPDPHAVAEAALAAAWGGPVRLAPGQSLREGGRSHVCRHQALNAPASAPPTVIVKQALRGEDAPYAPDALGGSAELLFNEWAALALLTEVAGDLALAPRFYAGDRAAGLIVMEDLGDGDGLHSRLLGHDPAVAEAGLVALATGLGQLHARTAGQEARYWAIRDALGPRPASQPWRDQLGSRLQVWLSATGVPPAPSLEADLDTLATTLAAPGPFTALIHGDPCLDNWRYSGDRLRLLDFELSNYGHALLDGVYGRIHFPTCWCVDQIPYAIVQQMEAAYQAALIPGCPEAADDTRYHQAVVVGCAAWGIRALPPTRLLEADIPDEEGMASFRQRVILRLTVLVRVTAEYRHLEALGATVRALVVRLRTLWPEATAMPYYPAFRGEFDG